MALPSRSALRGRAATEESIAAQGSARMVRAVVASDTTDLPDGTPVGLWIGTAGTLNFDDETGEQITGFPAVAGFNPIAAKRVRTGGTASDIWALYNTTT